MNPTSASSSRAMDEFKSRIPDLAQSLREHIADAHKKNKKFQEAFDAFLTLCRASLNPDLSEQQRGRDAGPAPADRAADAQPVPEPGIHPAERHRRASGERHRRAGSGSFSAAEFLKKLDPYYKAIERAGANLQPLHREAGFSELGLRAVFPGVFAGRGRYARHRLHAARNRGLHVQRAWRQRSRRNSARRWRRPRW